MTHKQIEYLPVTSIRVLERARKDFDIAGLAKLSESLTTSIGMLHPILILSDNSLLTGERRLRAVSSLHDTGSTVNFAGNQIPFGTIPCIRVTDTFDALDYLISEEAENEARVGFTWQEQVALTERIAKLKQLKLNQTSLQATLTENLSEGKRNEVLAEVLAATVENKAFEISQEAAKQASVELYGEHSSSFSKVNADLKMAEALRIPELAAQLSKAPTRKEAEKVLGKIEKDMRHSELARQQGQSLKVGRHKVLHGDCIELMKDIPSASIDVCLTDPPYGINAHKFGVAKRDVGVHAYEDTPEQFAVLLPAAIAEISRILKPSAHMYMFCDHINFQLLRGWIEAQVDHGEKWQVQSFPVAWIKTNGSRCPVPGFTFRKTIEWVLFAWRGGKQSHHQLEGHFEVSTSRTETNGAAKEPEGLKVLLGNSCYPGDSVIDPFAGTGGTMIAADQLKLKSLCMEQDDASYGRMVEKLAEIS